MKVSQCVFRNKSINKNTEDDFDAYYKGKHIIISTDHDFGEPEYDHLKRFNMDVYDLKSGMMDCETYEDHHTIRDAIRSALIGSCLIKE